MPTLNKLEYLDETKGLIKNALNTKFNSGITDEDTFRSYVDKIKNIYNTWPKVTDKGTELSITAKKGKMVLEPYGNTQQDTYTGKNLFDASIQAGTYPYYNGSATYTVASDGQITQSATDNSDWGATNRQFTLEAGTYTISITNKPSTSNMQLRNITDDVNLASTSNNSATFTINDTKTVAFKTYGSNVTYPISYYVQIEKGSSATSYEKFVGGTASPNSDYPQPIKVATGNNTIIVNNEEYHLNLGSLEFCSIGTYTDYPYKLNGNWYKKSYIVKVVLDGSESGWGNVEQSGNYYRIPLDITNIINVGTTRKTDILCSKFKANTSNNYNICFNYVKRIFFYLSEGMTTKEAFLTAVNGAVLYYVLDTPTDTQITDTTLINQLEALLNAMAKDGTNNISSSYAEGNAPIVLNVTALMKGGN